MTEQERREATKIVIGWITESVGADAASFWAWEATPMPFGLPSDKQLEEGLRVAVHDLTLKALAEKVYAELEAASGYGS